MTPSELLRWLLCQVSAVLIALLVAAAGASAAEADVRSLIPNEMRESGKITAAMPLDFEPFNYLDENGQKIGLDVELMTAIAQVLGLEPNIERMGFAAIIPAVKGGRVDVGMSGMGILPVRLQASSFVRYGRLSSGLVVRRGNPTGVSTDAGCGHTIALEKGTNSLFVWQEIAKQCEAAGKPMIKIMGSTARGRKC